MDVPLNAIYIAGLTDGGTDERTFTPGADTSGLISCQGDGPRLEKLAMPSLMSVAPTANDWG